MPWLDGTSTARAAALLEVVFNVKTYGAVGDGSTNDTTTINAAIAAAVAAGGGVVFFPKGTYLCNGLVILGDNVQLRGSGWGSVIKQVASVADSTWLISAFGTGTGVSTNIFNIGLRDLKLLGRADTDTFTQYVHLLSLGGVSDVLVERCFFSTWRGDAVILCSNNNAGTQVERHNERVTIRGCKFDGGTAKNNRNGVTIIDGTDVWIEGCYFTSCTSSGMPGAIDIEPNANAYHRVRNVMINQNSFDAVAGAAGVVGVFLNQAQSAYTLSPRNIQITNNTFKSCTNGASPVYIHQAGTPTGSTAVNDIVVDGNKFYDNLVEWLQAEGVRGLKISRNRVLSSPNGVAIGYAFKCVDVEILDNYCIDVGTTGDVQVTIYTADRVAIDRNTFDGGATKLVVFENNAGSVSTQVTFTNNRVPGSVVTTASAKNASHTLSVDTNQWYGNDTSVVPSLLHFATNTRVDQDVSPVDTVTYSASMTPDAALSSYKKITPTNTTAMTINAPTQPLTGQLMTIDFLNSSGGTMGVVTWNAAFKLAGAFTNPANTKRRTISFRYDGTSWVELNRAAADI